MDNNEIDLKHYRPTCKGCQFTNLSDYNNKCPYFSHPKNINASLKCFFRQYVTIEQLYETRKFISSEKSKMPNEIKKYLQAKKEIEEKNYREAVVTYGVIQ